MSSSNITAFSSVRAADQASPVHTISGVRSDPTWMRFWLPVILIAACVWVTHYQSRFATFSVEGVSESSDVIESVGSTSPIRQLLFPTLGAVGALLLVRAGGQRLTVYKPLAAASILLLLILGASVLWSEEPERSLRRVMIVYFVGLAAIGIGRHWTPTDLCRAALVISGFFAVVSVLLELRSGSFLAGPEYRFSGAFHPNQQAVNTAVLALSSLCLFRHTEYFRYLCFAGVGVTLTILTGSRGGLLALVVAVAAIYWLTMQTRRRVTLIVLASLSVSVGMILVSLSGSAPDIGELLRMGRADEGVQSSLLTGRIPIWIECIKAVSEQPLLGYGYGAFWTPKRVLNYSYIHDWAFSHSHSVYIETALNIGIIGLLTGLAVVMMTAVRAKVIRTQTGDESLMLIPGLICMGAVSGLVDSVFIAVGLASILLAVGLAIVTMYPQGDTK